MALSNRKSRKIIVDNEPYRWSPSQDSGYMILVVQHESGKGKKLEVVISDDKNIVVENGSYSIEVGDTDKLIITPKLVQKIILDAIRMGWNATELGPPVELSLENSALIVRRGF